MTAEMEEDLMSTLAALEDFHERITANPGGDIMLLDPPRPTFTFGIDGLQCERCHMYEPVRLPVSISTLHAFLGFVEMRHRDCKESK